MTVRLQRLPASQVITSRKLLELTDPNRESDRFLRSWKQENLPYVMRGINKMMMNEEYGIPGIFGLLYIKVIKANGDVLDYGLVSTRVVTTVGVNFIVDAFQNIVTLSTMRYHGIGTGNVAENIADTALQTELTTQYNPDNTRATGTLTEGSSANIFRTVGTNQVDAAGLNIVEHGIFSQQATGGGVMLDRSVFTSIGLGIGDSLQSTYEFTITAGS